MTPAMSLSLPLTGLNSASVVISLYFPSLQVYLVASGLPDCSTAWLLPDACVDGDASLDDKEEDDSGGDSDASLLLLVLDSCFVFADMFSPPWLAEDTGDDDDSPSVSLSSPCFNTA